jgi:DNA-binding transcriptional MocR family regulator
MVERAGWGQRDRALHRPGGGPVAPRYRQIEQALAAQIRRPDLPAGSLVSSARQICERYAVSPITSSARWALLALTKQGLVYRQVGIGSFVADAAARSDVTLVFTGFDTVRWRASAGAMGERVGGVGEAAWRHDCLRRRGGVGWREVLGRITRRRRRNAGRFASPSSAPGRTLRRVSWRAWRGGRSSPAPG